MHEGRAELCAQLVRVVHAHACVGHEGHGDARRDRATQGLRTSIDRAEALSVGVLHDARHALVERGQAVHTNDIHMIDLPRDLGVVPHAAHDVVVTRDFIGKKHQHHGLALAVVVRAPQEGLRAKATHERPKHRQL